MTSCKLNQIFLGEIASVQNYGAFIRIPGCAAQGLIHKSQVSSAHVDNVTDVLQRGERVWCKVISMGDDGKIGLSMKYVNQGSGTDLDPNGVELQRDLQKKKTFGKYESKAIHLEAVLNTTCTKCGTAGHLSKDCFMSPDGKKYELIPEIEERVQPVQLVQPVQPVQTVQNELQSETSEKVKKHKHKKTKKKQKSKKHKQDMDDSESDEKEVVKKKKKKHSKDQKKKKKKKHSSMSDESSGDSSSSHDVKSHKRKRSESMEKRTKKCKHSKSKYPDR